MARAEIDAGVCGFKTVVETRMDGDDCLVSITSDCPGITRMGADLQRVDPYREITFRGGGPATLEAASRNCKHPACPVPAGVIKAIEVAAGLALPRDASVKVTAD